MANLEALCRKGVRGFGDDEPGDKISDGPDTSKNNQKCCNDSNEVEVPAIVQSKASTDSGDHAIVA